MPLGTGVAANSPPRPPSLCEGGDPSEDDADSFEHAFRLRQGLVVGEAQDEDATPSEEGVAKSIASLAAVMRRSIDLDGLLRIARLVAA